MTTAEYVAQVVDGFPPLTREQVANAARILATIPPVADGRRVPPHLVDRR